MAQDLLITKSPDDAQLSDTSTALQIAAKRGRKSRSDPLGFEAEGLLGCRGAILANSIVEYRIRANPSRLVAVMSCRLREQLLLRARPPKRISAGIRDKSHFGHGVRTQLH
jgi:hypothetical protein